jgi:phosphomannomutase/phosphoglucomutase
MAKINPEIFRAYDIRGIVDKDLTSEIVEKIGRGYAAFLDQRRIRHTVVGYDCRLSSEKFKDAMISGLTSSGVHVVNIGLSLVQMMYWAQYHFKTNGGVFISASHNPKEFNGMKLAVGFSNTMVTDEIQRLKQIIEKEEFIKGEGSIRRADITNDYFEDILKRVEIKKKFKVVVDPSCSTPGKFVPELLRKAGCEVIEQNCELDGNFPCGTPDPTEKKVAERLAFKVLEEKADLGFSFDSDGDRIGVVDEKGRIIWNDMLVTIFAEDVLEHMPKAKIVYNALCSRVVDEVIRVKGGQPIMWMTGHSFIKEKVAIERAPFGGELSGHFFFADNFFGHDDGCFTALRFLEYLSNKKMSLSQVVDKFPKYISSPEIKVGCPDDKKVRVVKEITEIMKKDFPKDKITDIDGLRVDFSDGMIIIRYSHNGPYLTVKFESKTKQGYEKNRKYCWNLLRKFSEIDWSFGVNVDSLK